MACSPVGSNHYGTLATVVRLFDPRQLAGSFNKANANFLVLLIGALIRPKHPALHHELGCRQDDAIHCLYRSPHSGWLMDAESETNKCSP